MSRRVLLVAHHCNPEWTSEPLIGWRWVSGLAERTDVTLVTHVRNRGAIERAGLDAEVHYARTERLAAAVNRLNDRLWSKAAVVNRSLLEAVALGAFDRAAFRVARDLVARDRIDVIHRVSPISPRAPSALGSVGVPFVIGPVNGGMRTAPGFVDVALAERAWAQTLRPLARVLDPFQSTFRDAAHVFSANRTTLGVLPETAHEKTTILCENAVDIARFRPRIRRSGRVLRALYVGRLLPYKGVQFLLRALGSMPAGTPISLDVVGDGPARAELEALSAELGLSDRVTFFGAVPSAEVPRWMESADVLVLPSVRESGGSVPLEAMAAGTPAIVADHGGPAETVIDGTGVRVEATSPETLIAGLRSALTAYAADEAKRSAAGRAGVAHVRRHYTWAGKVERALAVYDQVRAARAVETRKGA